MEGIIAVGVIFAAAILAIIIQGRAALNRYPIIVALGWLAAAALSGLWLALR